MTLRKKENPKASKHYMGWRPGKILLLPVAGEFFLLTLPFIEALTGHLVAGSPSEKGLVQINFADFLRLP